MNLHVAQSMLLRKRRDTLRQQLSWLPAGLYRSYLERKQK